MTDTAPARDDGSLDVSRCAALHNFLVRYGWAGMGHSLSDVPRQNFFEKYNDDAGGFYSLVSKEPRACVLIDTCSQKKYETSYIQTW